MHRTPGVHALPTCPRSVDDGDDPAAVRILAVTICCLALFCCAPARAEFVPEPVDGPGAFTLLFENDIFGALGDDHHYTQGLRFSYLTREGRVWNWVEGGAKALPLFPDDGRLRATYSLGQNLYTPEDIKATEVVVDDRPYAGWLYAAVGLVSDTRHSLDIVEFSVGVVGPAALGEPLQRWVHGIIGSPIPMGWDNQLHNELTLQLFYERKWRFGWRPGWLQRIGLGTDLTPHAGAGLGNVFIQGATGATLRIGSDLPADYGTPRIRPSLPGSEFFVPTRRFSGYLFAGLEARAVARNIFLDGNTFGGSHSVKKFPLVGDFQGGLALVALDTRLAFTYVIRTREFELQNGPDRFGAFSLSFRF